MFKALSKRQQEVLFLVYCHKSGNEISSIMCISERTVRYHISMAMNKLQAKTRYEAVAKAIKFELLTP